jgi:hypothetical protein
VAALLAPATASAEAPSYAKTRVWGFEVQNPAGVGAERGLSADGTRGYGQSYDEEAVGYPLVPRGTAAGAGRATRFGSNWQRASLDETVGRIAGPNPIVETTASGKQIFRNPDTGLQVVYDTAGNYFRVENPGVQGVGRYLDLFGNEIPANVPLVGPRGTTQTGVPRDVRNGLTHFLNVD